TGVAVLKERMPNPDIERIEVSKRHAGLGVSQKLRSADAGLGKAAAFEAAVDAVLDVDEPVVGIAVAGVEMRLSHVPRLVHRNGSVAPAVQSDADEAGIRDAVEPYHPAARFYIPDEHGRARILPDAADTGH